MIQKTEKESTKTGIVVGEGNQRYRIPDENSNGEVIITPASLDRVREGNPWFTQDGSRISSQWPEAHSF